LTASPVVETYFWNVDLGFVDHFVVIDRIFLMAEKKLPVGQFGHDV